MIRNVLIIEQCSFCFTRGALSNSTEFEVMGCHCFKARQGWWSDTFGGIESGVFYTNE